MSDLPSPSIQKRPRFSRLLAYLFVLLAVIQLGAAIRAVTLPPELAAQMSIPSALEFVTSIFWLGVFALHVRDLLRRSSAYRARRRALITLNAAAWVAVGRLALFAQADYDRERLPFLLILLGVGFILSIILYGVFS